MTHHRFGRADGNLSAKFRDGSAFRCVIENRRRTMGIHIIDRLGRQISRLKCPLHCKLRADARGMRLSQMVGIGRDSVPDHFSDSDSAPTCRALLRLQDEKSSALAQDQPRSVLVKRTDFLRSSSLERIETDKNKLAQWLVPSTHDTGTQPVADQLESVSDRI